MLSCVRTLQAVGLYSIAYRMPGVDYLPAHPHSPLLRSTADVDTA
jgi:hypothetical protein